MKKLIIIKLFVFLFLFSTWALYGEVVYLKDGQVINGALVGETKEMVKVKTKYKTFELKRNDILRILYGERKLERVYIQMKDNMLVNGYMVDQDNKKVIIRPEKDNPAEVNILKDNIQQISNERILMLLPEFSLRSGIFMPLNTGNGSDLDLGYIFLLGFGMRIPFLNRSRVHFETGFVKNSSAFNDYTGENKELRLYTIPIILNYIYTYNLDELIHGSSTEGGKGFLNSFYKRTYIIGKIGAGVSYLNFDNGEDEKYSGIFFSTVASIGFSFEIIERIFYIQIANDFLFIIDKGSVLIPYTPSISLNYRY